jgi:transcriptional regulator with XRE-family HTH domain
MKNAKCLCVELFAYLVIVVFYAKTVVFYQKYTLEKIMVHLGSNIAKLRGFRRIPQKDIAERLNITQQEYSRIESKDIVDDDMLERIAIELDFPVELIKTLDNDKVQNVYQQNGNKGHVFNYDFSSAEKIVELYEKLLKEKDATIQALKNK